MNTSPSFTSRLMGLGIETSLLARHLIVWAIEALVLIGLANWLPGVRIDGFRDAFFVIVALATINALVMPTLFRVASRLRAFLFPIITFLLNGSSLIVLDGILPNWDVDGWLVSGLIAAILTAVATMMGSLLAINDERAWQRYSLGPMRSRYMRNQQGVSTTPGFVFLEIDGLAEPIMRDAIAHGYAPNLASWIEAGTHRLDQWECDLSSQTSGSQAGILLGNNENIPAFRWYDKELGRVIVSNHLQDTALLEHRLSRGDGLLVDGGASRGNLFSGDAPDSLFTFSTIGNRKQGGTSQYWFFYANLYNIARTLALFLADALKEVIARIWQLMRNERPRVSRGGIYPFVRAATTSFLREFSTFTVAGDMMRGVPSIYTTYLAYDEVAHHSGIARGDTLRVLKAIDRDIGRLARLASDVSRPYHLVVLSDHGQSQGATFLQRYDESLRQVVERLVSDQGEHSQDLVYGSVATDEGWQTMSALLTDMLATDAKARPVMQKLFRRKISDGELDLGPVGQEEKSAAANVSSAAADVVVLASGSLGLISFTAVPARLTLEAIEASFPTLVPSLVEHPGIGFVVVQTEERGPIAIGKDGICVLDDGRIIGENPLAGYGPNAARHLLRAQGFVNAPDIYVNARIDLDTGEIPAFEELVGSHGGLGGTQAQPFLLHPVTLDPGPERIVGAEHLYHTFKRWLAESHESVDRTLPPDVPTGSVERVGVGDLRPDINVVASVEARMP